MQLFQAEVCQSFFLWVAGAGTRHEEVVDPHIVGCAGIFHIAHQCHEVNDALAHGFATAFHFFAQAANKNIGFLVGHFAALIGAATGSAVHQIALLVHPAKLGEQGVHHLILRAVHIAWF